jgi:hypothetical protein
VAGIVGRRTRRARCDRFPVGPGDLLVMHTDGVASRWQLEDGERPAPSRLAQALLTAHGRSHDDATCLVIRWDGLALAETPGGASP